jgi:IS605 OrfB family transposase
MCFGSRKAFNAQHHLKENRFADHGAWLMHWRKRRENQFQVVGSNDEPGGNMTCRARIENDAVQLKLTTLGGEKICIGPLVLPYGHQEWLNAIMGGDAESRVAMDYQRQTADMVARYRERGCWPTDVLAKAAEDGTDPEKAFRRMRFGLRRKMAKLGHAVSYRFRRDEYGWRMFVTIEEPVADVQLNCTRGAIGIDMNADHLAIASVNHLGVPVGFARIDTHVTNRSSGQRLAMYREAAAAIVRQALDENRPIVVEELDFMAKRRRLGEVGCKKKTRMLSSFATTMFKGAIVSAAKRAGVAIRFVNPAFTSVIGLTKAVDLGVSVHLAAAVTIARRAMGFAEAVSQKIRIPAGHSKPSVLPVPEWLQGKPLDMKGMQEIASSIKGVLEARPKRQTGKERRLMNSASAFIAGLTFDTG